MRINRIVVRNFRSFKHLDVPLSAGTTCLIGENNTGKTNLLHAIRLCIVSVTRGTSIRNSVNVVDDFYDIYA
jgi:predicted ATP-dependent endonuclease of OLD family